MGEVRKAYKRLLENIKEKVPLGLPDVNGKRILSRVLVTETGFGFVIEFINRLHVVTTSTITSNTVPDLHTYNHSTTIFSVYFY
jgi:hypothetical protein